MKFLGLVVLFGLLSQFSSAQQTYYFTASQYLRPGKPYDIHISIDRPLPQPLQLEITVKQNNSYDYAPESPYYVEPSVILRKSLSITAGKPKTTVQLMPPFSLGERQKFSWAIRTALEINCTGAFQCYHSAFLTLLDKTHSIYVISDKAMYKPGDTIQFRAFAVDSDLLPYTGKFNIKITDPDSNIMKMWNNVTSDTGVISSTFKLSDQPPLGGWMLEVEADGLPSKTHSIQVQEYVLPKFEVKVDLPPYMLNQMDKMVTTVQAKYTFGKPVKGKASIAIGLKADGYTCREAWQENSDCYRYVPVCGRYQIVKELNGEGKIEVELTIDEMLDLLPMTVCDYRGVYCYKNRMHLNYQRFFVWANVTETLTDITLSAEGSVQFEGQSMRLQFLEATPNNYKANMPFIGYIQLNRPDGTPPEESDLITGSGTRRKVELNITLSCPYLYYYPMYPTDMEPGTNATPSCVEEKITKMLDINAAGLIAFEVEPVPRKHTSVALMATFTDKYDITTSDSRSVGPFETKNNYALRLMTEMEGGSLKPNTDAVFQVTASEEISMLHVDIIAKGNIVYSSDKVWNTPSKQQEFKLHIDEEFASKLAPSPRIIGWYIRKDGELIADSISFNVDSTLANQVHVKFSRNETMPNDDVTMMVEAYPRSAVGLMVVDQSVRLLASGNDLTLDMVQNELRQYNPNTPWYPILYYGGFGRGVGLCYGCWPLQIKGSDVTELFSAAGYLIFTDAELYKKPVPTYCHGGPVGPSGPGGLFGSVGPGGPGGPVAPKDSDSLQSVDRIRTEFPETWVWLDGVVGHDGRLEYKSKAPDTITSWVASAFALSKEKGLGVAATDMMTVFKPFFVSLTLPYALIRGEEFGLKATVFNYLQEPQDVTVTLDKSLYYKVLVNEEQVSTTVRQKVKVPANDAVTVVFWIIPTKVGNMNITVKAQSSQAADALQRTISVKPEGTRIEETQSILISRNQGDAPYTKSLRPDIPPKDLVEDSQFVKVTVIGDIMGPVINNLNQLVKMPYGCGEQNMVNFVPNIQVVGYLEAASLNMPELRAKAISYMELGYQKEVTYKRRDGSFSIFGERDEEGSTWLTAFVLKSFAQAQQYITVDNKHILDSLRFLNNQQQKDGSFSQPGRSSSYLTGGSGSGAALTAYVVIAMATARDAKYSNPEVQPQIMSLINATLERATAFLQSNMTGLYNDTYSMAITTYALLLVGSPHADVAIDKLNQMAIEKNGMMHWSNSEEKKDETLPWYYRQTSSFDIEMTSYAMLANLRYAAPEKTLPILKWLTSKRNAYGGYMSTQDTVLGLEAMTKFATMTFSPSGKQKMYVRISTDERETEFDPVTAENSMVLQVRELPYHVDAVTVIGEGSGIAVVQMIVSYNIRDPDTSKDVSVVVSSQQKSENTVHVEVCFQWVKVGTESGMGIVEVTPLSGYEPDTDRLLNMYADQGLKRVERSGATVITYWEKFEEKVKCLNIAKRKIVDVSNMQEAEVKVYSYYQPEKSQTVLYLPGNLGTVDPCSICQACCQSGGIDFD